jgi:hypothetical protein
MAFKIPNAVEWLTRKKRMLFRLVFCTEPGRQVLQDLCAFCYVDQTTSDPDPYKAREKEGRRQVALYILEWINIDVTELGDQTYGNQPNLDTFAANGGQS